MRIASLMCTLASLTLLHSIDAQTSIIRRLTEAADWPSRYIAKAFVNTMTLSAAVGYLDPNESSPSITRQLLPPGSLFVYGGVNDNAMSSDDVWVSTTSGKSWSLAGGKYSHYAGSALSDRLFSASCYDALTGRAYSIGGTSDGRTIEHTSRVASSADGMHWEIMSDNGDFDLRNRAACAVDVKGQVVVAGGNADGQSYNDVWRSSDLGATWRQATRNAPFGRRSGMTMRSFNSSLVGDLLYVVSGEQEVNNGLKLHNDIWISSSSGSSWTQLTSRANFPVRTNAQLTISSTGVLIVSGGSPSTDASKYHNDIWASLDGGYSWGACCVNGKCGYAPRMDHMTIVDNKGVLLIMGGTGEMNPEGFNDIWQSTFNFDDAELVADRCKLDMPADNVIGLRCWPTDEDCVIPDPDADSSTGHHSGGGSSKSGGITIEAVLGIVGALIFSLALLYYIVRRYRDWLEAKCQLRETELQYLNIGAFSAPTTHTSLIANAYDRSDLYEPPQQDANQPQPL